MKLNLLSALCGVLFAIGLVVSQMVNPNVVLGFLDIFGQWDPSLLFVMVGAVGLNLISFPIIMKRKPYCATCHVIPTNKSIDGKLITGSALFGIGWGLLGICPGPGLVNLATGKSTAVLFVVSIVAGMLIFKMSQAKFSKKR